MTPLAPRKELTMAKSKAELLEEANALNLEVTAKNTVAEINEAIAAADKPVEAPVVAEKK